MPLNTHGQYVNSFSPTAQISRPSIRKVHIFLLPPPSPSLKALQTTTLFLAGRGVYARACIQVAHRFELYEKGLLAEKTNTVNSLFRLAALQVVRDCEAEKVAISSLKNIPEEVRIKLEALRVEVPEAVAAVFGWVSLMPSSKARLQQCLLATLRATADPELPLADRSGGKLWQARRDQNRHRR